VDVIEMAQNMGVAYSSTPIIIIGIIIVGELFHVF